MIDLFHLRGHRVTLTRLDQLGTFVTVLSLSNRGKDCRLAAFWTPFSRNGIVCALQVRDHTASAHAVVAVAVAIAAEFPLVAAVIQSADGSQSRMRDVRVASSTGFGIVRRS